MNLDLNDQSLEEYTGKLCSVESKNLISNPPINEVMKLDIGHDEEEEATIYVNGEDKGPKVCIKMGDNREWLVTEVNGETSAFHKITGHTAVKNKDNGYLELLWTDSNVGDSFARQNLFMKFNEGDKE